MKQIEIISELGDKGSYKEQGKKFLEITNTTIKIKFLKYDKYFEDDKEKRDIYNIILIRGEREYKFQFGQSINTSGEYILYPSLERIHLSLSKSGKPNKNIKGFGLLTNNNSKKNKDFEIPNAYDILSCLTKYPIEDFNDFCADFGYDNYSIKAKEIYEKVKNEWLNIERLFNDKELEMLREIQ